MLNNLPRYANSMTGACLPGRQHQQGVVLMVALIILTALMIGGVALIRSVDTTGLISGNLAFQQSATRSGEAGTEDAIRSFIEASTEFALQNNDFTKGYAASIPRDDTGNPPNWETHWATIDPSPKTIPVTVKSCGHGGGRVCTLPTDAAGNTVSYTIQRMCLTAGSYNEWSTGCAVGLPLKTVQTGGGGGSEAPTYTTVTPYYYRVTTRTVGPRNTVSFIQTIVAK
jgi:type IV pilus assembly protein PilX